MDFMPATAYSYVRFSTPQQLKGDSLRRQLEASARYVSENGLVLDETLNLPDLGISAYRGKNVERGALGAFIKAIEAGRVQVGSYLIVESLDRLSRTEVIDALEPFLKIIRAGINIVTLVDDHVYSKDSIRANFTELIISISVMSRAHEESKVKSFRRKERWKNAKEQARETGKKITRKIPFWLSLPDRNGDFVVKKQESSLVRRIFELSSNGFGYWKICQDLNQKGIASPGSSTSWGTSTVGALIRGKTVLGHLEMKDGTIENYYPAIISQELWASAQPTPVAKRRSNAHKSNVFTGLLYCGDCGGRMQVDSSPDREGEMQSRIVCQRARRGQGCKITVWRMNEFEYAFLKFVHEIDVGALVGKQPIDPALSLRIDALSNQIEDIESKVENLLRAIEVGESTSMVARIQEYESTLSALKKERALKVFELQQRLNADAKIKTSMQSVSAFYIRLSVAVSDEKYVELRYSLATAISSVVERIDVYPRPLILSDSDIELESRKFLVTFRNGASRYVVPEEEFNMALTAKN
jgi:DNA invertase Pin-like site-specific DNA recombinase